MAGTRLAEQAAFGQLTPHLLMQRAGLAVAKLALAAAPHARHVWIACGPGNNGGDGLEAACHLKAWGKQVTVTRVAGKAPPSADTAFACQRALAHGLVVSTDPPPSWDLCVDALLGIGAKAAPSDPMAAWIDLMNGSRAPVLSVDVPTGLNADTGEVSLPCVQASFTLSLLTLKPGLFTASGRDVCGDVWLDSLDVHDASPRPDAWLGAPQPQVVRRHASHKGSYGDVAVIGGAAGMTGAAMLAASAALHAGAGRVFVSLLQEAAPTFSPLQPEIMFRSVAQFDVNGCTLVCGCGGGTAVKPWLPKVFGGMTPVVIDADAINEIAKDSFLEAGLSARAKRGAHSVLTPHPLEAARLLGTTTAEIQKNRLAAVHALVARFRCTVVLKGSGTVIASPDQVPVINPTGNARLATAGTGDVLAGMVGAKLARGLHPFEAACDAVYQHGLIADHWLLEQALTASGLAQHQWVNGLGTFH